METAATDKTAVFEQHRALLEGLAYRLLGTWGDAQDVVQDTSLQWLASDTSAVCSPRAWLVTVCSRTALNQLKSARCRREQYVGEWLPEPLPDPWADDGVTRLELDQSISVALLRVLETLGPDERAAWLLHDVFGFSFDEVATMLGKGSAACRQLASRARKRVREDRPRFSARADEHRHLLEAFFEAARQGQLQRLQSLLAERAELHADGGGKAATISEPLHGAAEIAAFFVRVFDDYRQRGLIPEARPLWFNGAPGLLLYVGQQLTTALTLEAEQGRITRLFAVRNPDKLGWVTGCAQ